MSRKVHPKHPEEQGIGLPEVLVRGGANPSPKKDSDLGAGCFILLDVRLEEGAFSKAVFSLSLDGCLSHPLPLLPRCVFFFFFSFLILFLVFFFFIFFCFFFFFLIFFCFFFFFFLFFSPLFLPSSSLVPLFFANPFSNNYYFLVLLSIFFIHLAFSF